MTPSTEAHVCPISGQPMKDPVLLETGCVYDRASILRWFQSSHTCPCTRLPVNVDAMVPLFELAQEIAACSPSEKTREREDPPNVTHPICAPPDIAFQLGQLASTSNPSIRLRILQSLTHRMHRTPRLERDLCMQLINHGAVHILTSILLHQETSSTLCVYTADLLSILSTYPGVDAMLLQAANGSNLLPHPLVFSTTKPKCCSMTAKRLAMVVGMLDPHTPGCKDVTCGMLWALWLVTPWSHLRTHLVKRTKMLKVLHAHVSMHIEGIERRGVEHANVKALVAACHVLRSLALVGAGAEGMVGTLYAMRSAMIKWCGGGGVDDDDAARLVIMDTQSQLFNILTSTFASALANACFMLRRAGGARGGGLGRLLGVGSHSASQQFLQSTAVDHSTLRAVQWLLRVAMMRDDPDVLGMHAACALLRSMLISPTAVHAALRAGLGAVMLRGCASQDEVVCLSSARVAVVMATEGGDGGRVTMGVMGGVTTAAMLMMRGDECGVLGGKLLAALLCVRTVDFFVAEGVWTMLVGLLGAGGDDPRVHSAAHLVLQILRVRPSAASAITYDHCAALRALLLQLDSIHGGPLVQRNAAECLALVAANEGPRALLLKVGTPHALVATLRRATHVRRLAGRDVVLAQQCLSALCVLARAGGVYLEEVLSACEDDRRLRLVVGDAAFGVRSTRTAVY